MEISPLHSLKPKHVLFALTSVSPLTTCLAGSSVAHLPVQVSGSTEWDGLTLFFAALFVLVAFVTGRRRFNKLMTDYEREMGERFD